MEVVGVNIQCMDLKKDLKLDDLVQLKEACECAIQFQTRWLQNVVQTTLSHLTNSC